MLRSRDLEELEAWQVERALEHDAPKVLFRLGLGGLYRLDAPPRKEGVAVLLKGLVRSKTLLDLGLLRVAALVGLGDRIVLISKLQIAQERTSCPEPSALSGASSRPSSS